MSATSRLPGVFYLDDPHDGVSTHLLREVGAVLHRGGLKPEQATKATTAAQSIEHTVSHSWAAYSVAGTSTAPAAAFVDVRDSADAWIRVVLNIGDVLELDAAVRRRVPSPGTPLVAPSVAAVAAGAGLTAPGTLGSSTHWGNVVLVDLKARGDGDDGDDFDSAELLRRFAPGSAEEAAANVPHFLKPGNPSIRDIVVDLCGNFYTLGWVTGTGGSISIRHGGRIFMAPSGVQKERMQPNDIFVLDTSGAIISEPIRHPGRPPLKLSQCAPLFQHAFNLRGAGACIHTHDINAVMCTLQNSTEWAITHQEMIKGIAGHGFLDRVRIPDRSSSSSCMRMAWRGGVRRNNNIIQCA